MAALPPLVTLNELETWMGIATGSLTESKLKRAKAMLDYASALVRDGTKKEWADSSGNLLQIPEAVQGVVLTAARRFYTNPNAEIDASAGPFGHRIKAAEVSLALTESEEAVLNSYRQKRFGGLRTLSTTKGRF